VTTTAQALDVPLVRLRPVRLGGADEPLPVAYMKKVTTRNCQTVLRTYQAL
jgi:hypothetical protein